MQAAGLSSVQLFTTASCELFFVLECVVTKIWNVPNLSKTHSKRPKATNEIKRCKIAHEYHDELQKGCIMLRDYAILNQTSYFPL